MDSSEATEEIIDQDDGEVSDDEAMESITDWNVSFFFNPALKRKKVWFSSTKNGIITKSLNQIIIWTQ